MTTFLSSEIGPMALAQAEARNGEPADDIMWRTLAEFNGKMVPPDGKGSIAATNGRILALESRMFSSFYPQNPSLCKHDSLAQTAW